MSAPTKKALTARCQQILHGATLEIPIANDEATRFLRDLLESHPEASEKIGCGVAFFVVRSNEWRKRTFWLVRHDGTKTDFSFRVCIGGKPTPEAEFRKACREAAYPSVLVYKKSILNIPPDALQPICPLTGETLGRHNTHIDHAPPWTFEALVQEFAAQFETLLGLVEPGGDGDTITRFANPELTERFRVFHDERALLRAVSVRANLSLLRRKSP